MVNRMPVHALDPAGKPDGSAVVVSGGKFTVGPVSSVAPHLSPTADLTTVKSTGNPTLAVLGANPENIIKVGDTYWLLYSQVNNGTPGWTRLYLASSTSPEGPWTPWSGNPILTAGSQSWEKADRTNGACLREHDGTFYLFYGSNDGGLGGIGLATASTVTGPYTKYASNPLITCGAAGNWDSLRVNEPDVLVQPDGTWLMAFMAEDTDFAEGSSEQVGFATASAPTGPWTKLNPNAPGIPMGATGEWDAGCVADPSLHYENGMYWCTYSGIATPGGKPWQEGIAYATDPAGAWTKHHSNPILTVGPAGSWEEHGVFRGAIYLEDGVYYLPYAGLPDPGYSDHSQGGNAKIIINGGLGGIPGHEAEADPHPQYLTQAEGDGRYVRTVNGVGPDASGNVAVSIPAPAASSGELLMQDGVTAPPVPLETEAQDDWLYEG